MDDQLNWTFEDPPSFGDSSLSIEEKFEAFHEANRWVLHAFIDVALEHQAKGFGVSISSLYEIVRYQFRMKTTDQHSDFKVNNNYQPYYARRIMEVEPKLAGAFRLRKMKGEKSGKEKREARV